MLSSFVQEFKDTYHHLTSLDRRKLAHQVLSLALVLCSALMIWKGLITASGSESPVVVVLTGSMEPAIQPGDILFLWQDPTVPYTIGEIIVYQIKGRDIPIIHRIIEVRTTEGGQVEILTKGDNNSADDRTLYNTDKTMNKLWLQEHEILGRAKGYLPKIGLTTMFLTAYPAVKYGLIAILGLFVLTTKE